jgi:hypothetical protein
MKDILHFQGAVRIPVEDKEEPETPAGLEGSVYRIRVALKRVSFH